MKKQKDLYPQDIYLPKMTIYLLFLFSFIILFLLLIETPTNGDTYVYAHSISTFEGPFIHKGYFFIGFFLKSALSIFHVSSLKTLGYLSVLGGSFAVVCMYIFTFMLTSDRWQSLISSLILLFSGSFWSYSTHGEVYVPQLFFVLLSVILIMKKRMLLSSLSIITAISITPTSCLAIPPMIYLAFMNKHTIKQILFFMFPILMLFVLLAFVDITRIIDIIKWAIFSPSVFLDNFSIKSLIYEVAFRVTKAYGKSFNFIIFIAVWGGYFLYRTNKKQMWLILSFILPFSLYLLNLGLFSSDHLILSFIPISFLASIGIINLPGLKKIPFPSKCFIPFFILCLYGAISYQLFIGPERSAAKEMQRSISKFSDHYKEDAIMIARYSYGMAFWYLTESEENYCLLTGRPLKFLNDQGQEDNSFMKKLNRKFWINLPHLPSYSSRIELEQLFNKRTIYFVDRSDNPTWIVKLLLGNKILGKRKKRISKVKKVVGYLEKAVNKKISYQQIVDSPSYPVYLLKIMENLRKNHDIN